MSGSVLVYNACVPVYNNIYFMRYLVDNVPMCVLLKDIFFRIGCMSVFLGGVSNNVYSRNNLNTPF